MSELQQKFENDILSLELEIFGATIPIADEGDALICSGLKRGRTKEPYCIYAHDIMISVAMKKFIQVRSCGEISCEM